MTQKEIEEIVTDIQLKLESYQTCLVGVALGEYFDDPKGLFVTGDTNDLIVILALTIARLIDYEIDDLDEIIKEIKEEALATCQLKKVKEILQ